MLLALDTTTPPGSLALVLPDGTCVEQPGDARPFGEQLPAAALALLARHGSRLSDVDVFAVATGPGSLTGLRVGMATVQGLAFAAGRPCVGVSVFDALTWAWLSGSSSPAAGAVFGVWLDARRDEVFTSLVRRRAAALEGGATLDELVEPLEGPSVGTPESRVAAWRPLVEAAARSVVVCGTRVERDLALLATVGPGVGRADAPAGLAAAVAAVAVREAARGRTVAPHALHPLYVRRPDVELARERARASPSP